MTIMTYDWALTLNDEVNLIWYRSSGVLRVLFLAVIDATCRLGRRSYVPLATIRSRRTGIFGGLRVRARLR